jgi:hypothetical protein
MKENKLFKQSVKALAFILVGSLAACGINETESTIKSETAVSIIEIQMKCWNNSPSKVLVYSNMKLEDNSRWDGTGFFEISFLNEDGEREINHINESDLFKGLWSANRLTAHQEIGEISRLFFTADDFFEDRAAHSIFSAQINQPGIPAANSELECTILANEEK